MHFWIEPGLAEGRQILPRVAVQKKLIPNQRMGHIGPHPVFGHPVFWNCEVSSLGTENIRVRRTPCVVTIMKRHMFFQTFLRIFPVIPIVEFEDIDEAVTFANDSDYGLTSSIYTRDLNVALRACRDIRFGETYINRENFEAMQGFHAGWRKSGIGGADGKHGLYEFMQTHMVYLQGY